MHTIGDLKSHIRYCFFAMFLLDKYIWLTIIAFLTLAYGNFNEKWLTFELFEKKRFKLISVSTQKLLQL